MAAKRAKAVRQAVNLSQLVPVLREALSRDGALNATALVRLGIPKEQHREAISLLEASGFERNKSGIRLPAGQQLRALVAERKYLPLREIPRLLRGVPAPEARKAAVAFAKEGSARLVLRGKIEVLVEPSVPTVSREQLTALKRACQTLAGQSTKALKNPTMTLLVEDVREQLLEHVARPQRLEPPSPTPVAALVDVVVRELPRHLQPSVMLSFVPDVVRALTQHTVSSVHEALLSAARTGRIELRPESGLNRLTHEEMELCPPGPQGTRLSWARLLEDPA